MTAGEVLLVVAGVLCALAFAALAITLLRVTDALRQLRATSGGARRDGATAGGAAPDGDEVRQAAAAGPWRPGAVRRSGRPRRSDGRRSRTTAVRADDQGRRAGHRHVAGRPPSAARSVRCGASCGSPAASPPVPPARVRPTQGRRDGAADGADERRPWSDGRRPAIRPAGRRRRPRGTLGRPGARARAAGRARRAARPPPRPPAPRRRGARRRRTRRVRPGDPAASTRPAGVTARTAPAPTLVADLRQALGADRVRDGRTELSLYRHDASNMEGAAVAVCFPLTTAEVQACVAGRQPARRAVRPPRLGHRAGRRGRPTGRGGRHRDDEDEPHPVGRRRRPAGVGRAGCAQPRPQPGSGRRRAALRPGPEQPADVLDRRQRGQQLGRPALPRRGCDERPRPRPRGRAPGRRVDVLGGEDPEPVGYDLRGVFVGSEGMFGIATRSACA